MLKFDSWPPTPNNTELTTEAIFDVTESQGSATHIGRYVKMFLIANVDPSMADDITHELALQVPDVGDGFSPRRSFVQGIVSFDMEREQLGGGNV